MSGTFVILLCCLAAFASAVPQNNLVFARVPEFCLVPPVANVPPCNNFSLRYYYDARTRDCEKILYSGCGGTSNLFVSERDCERRCEDFNDNSKESFELFD